MGKTEKISLDPDTKERPLWSEKKLVTGLQENPRKTYKKTGNPKIPGSGGQGSRTLNRLPGN